MLRLDLTLEEAEALQSLLGENLRDLRAEIVRTEQADFRRGLKEREALLKSLIERIEAGRTAPSR
jgi:hypothetical protein